jgi:hypothetical protein
MDGWMDDQPFSMETDIVVIVILRFSFGFFMFAKALVSQYGMQGTKRFTILFFPPF